MIEADAGGLERQPDVSIRHRTEAGAKDADDLVGHAAERDHLADGVLSNAVLANGERAADDRDAGALRDVLGACEHSALIDRRAEHVEVIGRDVERVEVHLAIAGHERHPGARMVGGHPLEHLPGDPGAPRAVLRHRRECRAPGLQVAHELDEPIGLGIRERAQQHAAGDREHGGVGADADRQHEDGRDRKRRTAPERARRVSDVMDDPHRGG